MDYSDLQEHTTVLVALIGVFAGLTGFLFWRILSRLEAKLDALYNLARSCRESLPERFVGRDEYEREVVDLWKALNRHDHDQKGRVVRC